MDIAGIWQSLQGIALPGASSQGTKPVEAPQPQSAACKTASLSPQAQEKLRDILARYDVTSISPRSFSQLIGELKQAGAITDSDQEELALVRLDLDKGGVEPDEQINLVDFLQKKLTTQQRDAERNRNQPGQDPTAALQATLRQIDWINKFALIHRSSDYQPLNAVV